MPQKNRLDLEDDVNSDLEINRIRLFYFVWQCELGHCQSVHANILMCKNEMAPFTI